MRQLMKDYGKGIMAILGVVLMLTFALPSLFKTQSDTSSFVRGKLNGKTITQGQINVAARDISILRDFNMMGLRILKGLDQEHLLIMPLDERDANTHWFLELTEAQHYGLYVSEGEIDQAIREFNLSEADIRTTLDKASLSDAEFRDAIRDALLIRKLGFLGISSVQVSVPQLELTADDLLSGLNVNYALLPDSGDLAKVPDPSTDQIQKQFDLYKNVEPLPALGAAAVAPTIDGHTYPFGYKYPDRVQAEWLKFDFAQIRSQFKPTREDNEAAYKYYMDHPDEFPNTPSTEPATQSASAPASQPATQAASQPAIKPFEQVRAELVDRQINDRAQKLMRRMVDRALAVAAEPWKTANTDAQGFRDPPPRSAWIPYDKVADTIQSNREFAGYKPALGHTPEAQWDSRADLRTLPGIGDSSYRTARENLPFPDLAVDVKELQPDLTKSPVTTRLSLQVGAEGPILTDPAGNMYVYRVTAADPAHEPKSLDEVRARVIQDLKRLALYQAHQQQAKQLIAQIPPAKPDDLLSLARSQGLTAGTSGTISRMPIAQRDPLQDVPGFVDAAFSLTEKSPTTQPASQPTSQAASAPATQPATVATTLDVDSALSVYVLDLEHYQPITPSMFSIFRETLFQQTQFESQFRFLNEWASLDAIAKRLNYVPKEPFPKAKEST